jgi:anti-sigma regulatory factor (Ser/Thr protein kinase)
MTGVFAIASNSYVHEAAPYRGFDDFVAQSSAFVADGLRTREAVLVAVTLDKAEALGAALGSARECVTFLDMADVGRNPARLIPAWQSFVDAHAGTPLRGIGEPIWAQRTAPEIAEAQLHEALLSAAFNPETPLRLRCPYDTSTLDDAVLDAMRTSHSHPNEANHDDGSARFRAPLPPAPDAAQIMEFYHADLGAVRAFVCGLVTEYGLEPERLAELVVAVNEATTNSVRHGGGSGRLAVWCDDQHAVCEVRDAGRIASAMVGRIAPPVNRTGGRGLWLANQLCDLVQVRSGATGTAVRMYMRLP